MNKDLIKKLLITNQLDQADVANFIDEYTHAKLNRNITGEELNKIILLLQSGHFDLNYALLEAARMSDLNVLTIADSNGFLIRRHVYESF